MFDCTDDDDDDGSDELELPAVIVGDLYVRSQSGAAESYRRKVHHCTAAQRSCSAKLFLIDRSNIAEVLEMPAGL